MIFLVAAAGDAATTRTWTGASDADWFNAANWSAEDLSVEFPQAGDNVLINAGTVLGNAIGANRVASTSLKNLD